MTVITDELTRARALGEQLIWGPHSYITSHRRISLNDVNHQSTQVL